MGYIFTEPELAVQLNDGDDERLSRLLEDCFVYNTTDGTVTDASSLLVVNSDLFRNAMIPHIDENDDLEVADEMLASGEIDAENAASFVGVPLSKLLTEGQLTQIGRAPADRASLRA